MHVFVLTFYATFADSGVTCVSYIASARKSLVQKYFKESVSARVKALYIPV
jgi:hypothetical protein